MRHADGRTGTARDAGSRRYFLVEEMPRLLAETAASQPAAVLADLGAGDGSLLFVLERAGLLGEAAYAIDLSRERVEHCESLSPRVHGIVADVTAVTELPDGSVDGVVASQLIEHLPDDRLLAPEIARLLRPGGWFYISSVIRGRHGWWIYRRDGHPVLDPTHVREYASPGEFRAALEHPQLEVLEVRSEPMRFRAVDLAARAAARARLLRFEDLPNLYVTHPRLRPLARFRVRVPGYHWVEAAGRRL